MGVVEGVGGYGEGGGIGALGEGAATVGRGAELLPVLGAVFGGSFSTVA